MSPTGTAILLKPGVIAGGNVVHDCPLTRSVGYFLEPIVMLAPFAKKPLQLTLRGITTDENDLSVSFSLALETAFSQAVICRRNRWTLFVLSRSRIYNFLGSRRAWNFE